MIYYKSTHLTIYWEENLNCVHTEWHGALSRNQLKDGLLMALDLAKEKGSKKWLTDVRDLQQLSFGDMIKEKEWYVQEWLPTLIDAGINQIAFMNPNTTIATKAFLKVVQAYYYKQLKIGYFDDLEKALKWLKEE